MRQTAESIARKSLQKMFYERISLALRLQPEPKAKAPSLKAIRELSNELADRLLGNPRFIETVGLIGKTQHRLVVRD